METIKGVVETKSRKGNSIKVGDDWYSTFKSADLDHIEWKDEVEFVYVQKGDFKNIKGRVQKVSGGGTATATSGGGKPYSNLGVELGHASNLAMRMMEQSFSEDNCPVVGTAEYYKQFMDYTEKMHKVMSAIRAKHESDGDATPVIKEESKPVKATPEVEDDDLF